MAAKDHRLLLLLNSLKYDGGKTRFLTFAESLRRRGGDVTILAGPGPLEERAAACGTLRLVDWQRRDWAAADELAVRAARGRTAVLVGAQPRLTHLVPRLALEAPVHLCLHTVPGLLEDAFARQGVAEALGLLPALNSSGRVLLTGAAEVEARKHAARLGLPEGSVAAWPNGVTVPEGSREVSTGPVRRVAVLARLVPEKLPVIAAAADLVAAGRAAGREVTLDVYGAGRCEPEVRSLLAAQLPENACRLHGETDRPLEAMRRADVVVATGRTGIEALMVGRRLVPVASVRGSAPKMGPPAAPDTFDLLVAGNFGWQELEPAPTAAVWQQLESLPADAVAEVRDRACRECSAEAMLDRELELLDELTRRTPRWEPLLAAAEQSDQLRAKRLRERRHPPGAQPGRSGTPA